MRAPSVHVPCVTCMPTFILLAAKILTMSTSRACLGLFVAASLTVAAGAAVQSTETTFSDPVTALALCVPFTVLIEPSAGENTSVRVSGVPFARTPLERAQPREFLVAATLGSVYSTYNTRDRWRRGEYIRTKIGNVSASAPAPRKAALPPQSRAHSWLPVVCRQPGGRAGSSNHQWRP